EARMRIAAGAPRDALPALEAARERLGARDDPALRARVDGALAEVYDALASGSLARAAAERALARWERIALDLPPSLRDAFWAHPHRRRARGARERPGEGRATLSLSRVRELNRRLSALHTQGEVLAFALDAAIELTGAERGFVLLRKDRGFEVAIAEQMDRTRMPKSAWKWSRSIAERVIGDGEPVLTVDAERDPRFRRNESVHAMHLKSVLCAPIRARGGILGALYLDNRLARARFSPDDAELLLSFADQVAIALTHAALVSELAQKARELAREKRKVELLARGQAREIERLEGVVSAQREQLGVRHSFADIVGRSEPMRRVLRVLDRVIDTDLSVLVQGESGTGKELIARALHRHGRRAERPFVSVNCAAIPAALLESELFGHVKGAFTGALSAREGLFATARSGTIFLDELGELPLPMQAKLLRVLQDGEVRPVGANKSFAVDVRVVCATNRDLKQRVSEGAFREDLFYRVSVVEIALPALRERHDDIVPIAEAILKQRAEALGEAPAQLAPDAVRALLSYGWPGNVRELQNVLLRASVMARAGAIGADDLDLPSGAPRVTTPRTPRSRDEFHRREAERLLSALSAERWNVSKVAKNLGMPRNTLYRKLARYGIQRTGKEQQQ
ncbi:MAG: sigma 54-interacting transcriptional regulator, partial [Polyangiales bacterium]